MIVLAEKGLKDAGDKVPEDVVKSINKKVAGVREVKDADDVAAIQKASEELSTEMQKIGEILQQQAAEATPSETEEDAEKVKDVEFEEKKEDSEDSKEE